MKYHVKCICPKCSKNHIADIFWTGTTTPRIFCKQCMKVAQEVDSQYYYKMTPIKICGKVVDFADLLT